MLYKNLTVKELFASIPCTKTIDSFFREGLKEDNDRLAVSAMEELILRGDTDMIISGLKWAFENGYIKIGTTMTAMIARSLCENCRGSSVILHRFGKFLYVTKSDDPVNDFINEEKKNYASDLASDLLAKIKNDKPTDA